MSMFSQAEDERHLNAFISLRACNIWVIELRDIARLWRPRLKALIPAAFNLNTLQID
jgi:hypothetical protein